MGKLITTKIKLLPSHDWERVNVLAFPCIEYSEIVCWSLFLPFFQGVLWNQLVCPRSHQLALLPRGTVENWTPDPNSLAQWAIQHLSHTKVSSTLHNSFPGWTLESWGCSRKTKLFQNTWSDMQARSPYLTLVPKWGLQSPLRGGRFHLIFINSVSNHLLDWFPIYNVFKVCFNSCCENEDQFSFYC